MSDKLYFYKREPAKFLLGIAHMTVEQIAVYAVMVELMYDAWSTIEDRTPKQRRDLARTCGLSVRKFGTTLEELVALGKLHRTLSGRLSNRKFERLAKERGLDTSATFDKNGKKTRDNRGDNRTDNEAPVNDLKGLEGEKVPVHARVKSEVRSQKAEAEAPAAPVPKTGLEPVHDALDRDIRRICRALGVDMQVHPGAHNWPHQWVRLQAEKEITIDDMLEAIASYGQQPILRSMKSLFWLKDRAIEKRVARTLGAAILGRAASSTATEQHAVTIDTWRERARMFLKYGSWIPDYGPSPLQPGCLMPRALLEESEQIWIAQGNHPASRNTTNGIEPWKPGAGMTPQAAPFARRKVDA
jgi:hypothetical protein